MAVNHNLKRKINAFDLFLTNEAIARELGIPVKSVAYYRNTPIEVNGMKICTKCRILKSTNEFGATKRYKDGRKRKCRACIREEHLLYTYGLTIKAYSKMWEEQNGKCKICKQDECETHPKNRQTLPLSVDHNHADGTVRGLLCRRCNHMLGNMEDNIDLLQSAIAYLTVDMERVKLKQIEASETEENNNTEPLLPSEEEEDDKDVDSDNN